MPQAGRRPGPDRHTRGLRPGRQARRTPLRSQRSAQRLRAITDLYRTGRLTLTVSKTFPLDRIADAHRRIDTGHARGKTAVLLRE
ncbi:zinc-binding dehydrogenase [Micromonospora sp. M12]